MTWPGPLLGLDDAERPWIVERQDIFDGTVVSTVVAVALGGEQARAEVARKQREAERQGKHCTYGCYASRWSRANIMSATPTRGSATTMSNPTPQPTKTLADLRRNREILDREIERIESERG